MGLFHGRSVFEIRTDGWKWKVLELKTYTSDGPGPVEPVQVRAADGLEIPNLNSFFIEPVKSLSITPEGSSVIEASIKLELQRVAVGEHSSRILYVGFKNRDETRRDRIVVLSEVGGAVDVKRFEQMAIDHAVYVNGHNTVVKKVSEPFKYFSTDMAVMVRSVESDNNFEITIF